MFGAVGAVAVSAVASVSAVVNFASAPAKWQTVPMRCLSVMLFCAIISSTSLVAAAPTGPAPTQSPPPTEYYVVRGTVQGYKARPISDAAVAIACTKPAKIQSDGHGDNSAWSGASDAKGHFESLHRLRGHCTITVTAKGYRDAVVSADLPGQYAHEPIVVALQALKIQR